MRAKRLKPDTESFVPKTLMEMGWIGRVDRLGVGAGSLAGLDFHMVCQQFGFLFFIDIHFSSGESCIIFVTETNIYTASWQLNGWWC